MNPEELKKLVESIKEGNTEVKNLISKQEDEIKSNGVANGETAAKLSEVVEKLEAKNLQLAEENEKKEKRITDLEVKMNRPSFGGQADEVKSVGGLFAESSEYKNYNGGIGQSFKLETKDITNDPASAGALVRPDRDENIYKDPYQLNYISNLFRRSTVSTDSIEVMRRLLRTNNAAPQAGQLAEKGKSDLTYSLEKYSVETLANYIITSKQVLSDQSRLQTEINTELMDFLKEEEDSQVFYGDGTGQNFTGVFVDPDVQDAGELPSGTTGADIPPAMIDHIRKAIRMLRDRNYGAATAIVLNPENYETIETAKGSDGHYILVSSPVNGMERLWRVPVIESNTIAVDDFVVGDFPKAGTIYDREQVTVQMSDSHADLFVKNGLAILAECRKAFAINNPNALVKGKFTVAV